MIGILAAAQQRQPRGAPWAAMLASLVGGLAAALVIMAALLGVRPNLLASLGDPVVWLKFSFSTTMLIAAGIAARRLSLPGKGWRGAGLVLSLAFVVALAWALMDLATHPMAVWPERIIGQEWLTCLVAIPLLSLPTTLVMGAAMRRLAPTRLDLAGTLLGLASGGTAAFAFALHCQDDTAPFVALWYSLALGVSALSGRIFGPLLLRW